jgi:hypothetical protein
MLELADKLPVFSSCRHFAVSDNDGAKASVPAVPRTAPTLAACTEAPMTRRHLRIFPSRTGHSTAVSAPAEARITLRELLPLVAMAQRLNMNWLRDFLDDEVIVTSDLYEVLQAFKSCRPSA